VVGDYKRIDFYDSLQQASVDNGYAGTGFSVATEGTMTIVGSSALNLAGMQVSGEENAIATFAMDSPLDTFSLTLSGIDNALGAMIEVFDVQGNLVHSETFVGGSDARHTKIFSFQVTELMGRAGVVEIGSFKVTSFSPSITLSGINISVPKHVADSRPEDCIEYMSETYCGGVGDDVVSLALWPTTYFAQETAAIHGGMGLDELRISGGGYPMDMTAAGGKISSMEVINLTGSGNNSLTLNLRNVIDNGGVNIFYEGEQSRVQMMIKGNSGDSVDLSDALGLSVDMGDWVQKGGVTVNGASYVSYQHSGLAVELLVQSEVAVTLNNTVGPVASRSAVGLDALGADVISSTLTVPSADIQGFVRAREVEGGAQSESGLHISVRDLRDVGVESTDAPAPPVSEDFNAFDRSLGWLSLEHEETRLYMS